MTNRTITYPGFTGFKAGVQFTNGTATVDDATPAGKKAIAFAVRHGLAVSGVAAAVTLSVEDGKPVAEWTDAELTTYLNDQGVLFPSNASTDDKRKAVQAAFEVKSTGGSASPEGAGGHTSGTVTVQGAPPVTNPEKPDDEQKTANWSPPLTGDAGFAGPVITTQPTATSKVQGATATYTVAATGTPEPSIQWQRQTRGGGAYADIDGATDPSYTTPALTVAENHQDRYRAILTNEVGSVTSTAVQQTVTAA